MKNNLEKHTECPISIGTLRGAVAGCTIGLLRNIIVYEIKEKTGIDGFPEAFESLGNYYIPFVYALGGAVAGGAIAGRHKIKNAAKKTKEYLKAPIKPLGRGIVKSLKFIDTKILGYEPLSQEKLRDLEDL